MALNLGSITLPEQLTELKEALCLLNYQFIIKGYNSGTDRLKSPEQEWGKGTELFRHRDAQASKCSSSPKFYQSSPLVFI